MIVRVLIAALWIDRHVASWALHWKCAALDRLIGVISPIGTGVTLLLACLLLSLVCRRPATGDRTAW